MSLLQLRNVAARYGRRPVIEDVSITVAAGEMVAVLGPNGAGKSTLLKACIGLATVSAGEVLLDGESITGQGPAACLARGLAYLPQGGLVFGPLSVADNLAAAGLGLPKPPDRERLEEVLAMFPDLTARRRERAGSLSGGQRQQLAIAMALLGEPRVMLVDEPSIGLAPRLAAEAMVRLDEVRAATETAMLLVEQNVALALEAADRAVLLVNGRMVAEASTAAIRHDAGLLRQFTFGLTSREPES